MSARRKNFTTSDTAVGKFFSPQSQDYKEDNDSQNTKDTYDSNVNKQTHITKQTKATHKSKHYDARGKRGERFGLLLDEQLKDDLTHLAMAKGSKSTNDFVVTLLLDYVEQEDNQIKLHQYRELLKN